MNEECTHLRDARLRLLGGGGSSSSSGGGGGGQQRGGQIARPKNIQLARGLVRGHGDIKQPTTSCDAREKKMKPKFSHNIITTPKIRLIRGIELAESQLFLVLGVN